MSAQTNTALPTLDELPWSLMRLAVDPQHGEMVIHAAAVLGAMKKRTHELRYTGVVDGRRRRFGQLVKMPCGRVVKLLGALRGQAVVYWKDPESIYGDQLVVVHVSDLRVVKNPAAVILGRLKAGARERPSVRKQRAARRNGKMPCRPGRKRGRPPRGSPEHRPT